jgi:N-methylhydantoinase B
MMTTRFEVLTDSAGPGKWRGGAGVQKTSVMLEAENTVISYICDRERAVVWGIEGGLPSMPHGLTLRRHGSDKPEWLGSVFSNVAIGQDDEFGRPTAGGGGFGDPLERDPERVLQDVIDDYVSVERAALDYGVVITPVDPEICEYEIDAEATKKQRERIRAERTGWLETAPEEVAAMFREGRINALDAVRRYAVILDWDKGTLLPKSTEQFREMFHRRTASCWA